ncbi:hypothetical protein JQ557_07690 [Bradyrhizobium sp. U87765 SZCCT0131]|nr:hypothetical protein [Bradyrhizobium sp. U87765 SZCCT0131]
MYSAIEQRRSPRQRFAEAAALHRYGQRTSAEARRISELQHDADEDCVTDRGAKASASHYELQQKDTDKRRSDDRQQDPDPEASEDIAGQKSDQDA